MKKLPIGIQTFSKIIEGNYCYVDKTGIAYNLIENANELEVESPKAYDLSNRFFKLILSVYKKYNQKVIILIDEYDKPIIDNISDSETALIAKNILASFYSAIKDSDQYLKFVFMTGVSKFSKMNLFSSLNNITDITVKKDYSTITGYTQENLEEVFAEYLPKVDLDKVKKWYNGYNYFGEPVYNPFDILQFLDNSCKYKNYWWETGNPRFLIEVLKDNCFNLPQLENITVSSETLNSFDIDKIDIVALLWQTGYLTFDKEVIMLDEIFYKMKIPNLEIQKSLNALFAEYYYGV